MALIAVGINHLSSPLAVREKIWLSELHRYESLRQLTRVAGIREVAILLTCHSTEFILFADDTDNLCRSES